MDGRTDGRTEESDRFDGWMDGRTDGTVLLLPEGELQLVDSGSVVHQEPPHPMVPAVYQSIFPADQPGK